MANDTIIDIHPLDLAEKLNALQPEDWVEITGEGDAKLITIGWVTYPGEHVARASFHRT